MKPFPVFKQNIGEEKQQPPFTDVRILTSLFPPVKSAELFLRYYSKKEWWAKLKPFNITTPPPAPAPAPNVSVFSDTKFFAWSLQQQISNKH